MAGTRGSHVYSSPYEAGASELERIARAVPIGAEDTTKGPSVYNWLTYAALRLRQSAALTATEDTQ